MPPPAETVAPSSPKEKFLRRTFRLLRESWRAHIQRPAALILLLAGCIALFIFDAATGHREPTAGDLSKLFAPAPLDAFTGVRVADGSRWRLAMVIPFRALFVVGVLALLMRRRWTRSAFSKVVAVELAATLSFAIPVVLGYLYFLEKASAIENPARWPGALALLAAEPLLFLLLTATFAPLACAAAVGEKMKLRLNDGAIWVLALISTWLWLFGYQRIDAIARAPGGDTTAYGIAFAALVLQSVIVSAISIRTIELSQDISSRKTNSSLAAEASAVR